jgi:hypothetical protein
MVAYTTADYATGWIHGDIKGAWLADTDTADLVGSGETVTNGGFDTDLSGWTDSSDGGSSISWGSGGKLELNQTGGAVARAEQPITCVAGARYEVEIESEPGGTILRVGTSATEGKFFSSGLLSGRTTVSFVPDATDVVVYIKSKNDGTESVDYISVKLADADRSVNGNGLVVNGTITRTPVATGAELVAYSGFSASDYFEQPYNADLDFGTGDFCVMGWFTSLSGDFDELLIRQDDVAASSFGTGKYFRLYVHDSVLKAHITGTIIAGTQDVTGGGWHFGGMCRRSGVLELWLNGNLVASASDLTNLDNANGVVRVGALMYNGGLANGHSGSLALLRVSATAPTAEQIAKIYNDEKMLFQENAACTLYGTSNAVNALAHDPDTGLLHVGTSDGRSVFQGLRRVANTTDAITTAISANNQMIAEE